MRSLWCVGGLGAGKSHGGQIWDIYRVLQNGVPLSEPKPSQSWTVAPNYRICETLLELTMQVAYDVFGMTEGRDYELRKAFPRTLDFSPHGLNHRMLFLSADNPQHFVSSSITHWRWSEVGVSKPEVFQKLHDRLRDKRAKILQGLGDGTPEGTQHPYFEWAGFGGAKLDATDTVRNFRKFRIETGHNAKNLAPGYVEALRARYAYDTAKLKSYELGLFVPFNKGSAYWEFLESRNVCDNIDANPDQSLILDFDFNVSPLAWSTLQQYWHQKSYYHPRVERFITINEGSGQARGLMDAVAEFASRHPLSLFRYTPILIDGDCNGYSKSHRLGGSSFEDIKRYLTELGYQNVTIVASKSNPLVRQRLEKVAALMAYEMYLVCARCQNTINGFVKTALKPGTWDIEKPQGDDWTHFPDAVGYPLYRLTKDRDILNPNAVETMGIA